MPSGRSAGESRAIASTPEELTTRKGALAFLGNEVGLWVQLCSREKYMDGLWSFKELDLNPTSICISCGTVWKSLNPPEIWHKLIHCEKGCGWHCWFPPQYLFYFSPCRKNTHVVSAYTPPSYASRWDPGWFILIMIILIPSAVMAPALSCDAKFG